MESPSQSFEPATNSRQMTSLSLLDGVKLRDAEAWRRMVRVYSPLVKHWCRRSGLAEQHIDDLTQETFAAVLRGMPTFNKQPDAVRPQGGSFRGWLRTIVGRKLIDFARARADSVAAGGGSDAQLQLAQAADPLSVTNDDADEAVETGLVFRAAVDLIGAEFEASTARAFWLTTVEDRAPDEVAAALGVSINAVYKAKSRVLRRLREVLSGLEE